MILSISDDVCDIDVSAPCNGYIETIAKKRVRFIRDSASEDLQDKIRSRSERVATAENEKVWRGVLRGVPA